eukprot:3773687-Pyramimonas_sp.AAC.1
MTFLDDVEFAGGPPPQSSQSRVTIDLHTQEMLGNHDYADGRPAASDCPFPSDVGSMASSPISTVRLRQRVSAVGIEHLPAS